MKQILAATLMVISTTLFAVNPDYFQKMGETLGKYGTCKTIEDYQVLANQFKVIASVENQEWLPLYYQAHCYIIMSFMETADGAKKDSYLDVTEEALKRMIQLAPNEAEIFTLQAFYYTARLVVNPQERGQKYSALSAQAVGRALAMDPQNPRAQLIQLQNEMGTARFFGNDITPYYAKAQAILANWDSYKIKSQLYPNWGKDQIQGIVGSIPK